MWVHNRILLSTTPHSPQNGNYKKGCGFEKLTAQRAGVRSDIVREPHGYRLFSMPELTHPPFTASQLAVQFFTRVYKIRDSRTHIPLQIATHRRSPSTKPHLTLRHTPLTHNSNGSRPIRTPSFKLTQIAERWLTIDWVRPQPHSFEPSAL